MQDLKQAIEKKLRRLLAQNPLRTDFQKHYEEIVAQYNRDKYRVTIEKTFEALLKLVQELDQEESRAVRERLDEESLAVFDLLKRPELDAAEIKQIKKAAVELLKTLKAEKLRVDQWRDREATRDAVKVVIHNLFWSELPETCSEDEMNKSVEDVFRHPHRVYPAVPSPYYEAMQAG